MMIRWVKQCLPPKQLYQLPTAQASSSGKDYGRQSASGSPLLGWSTTDQEDPFQRSLFPRLSHHLWLLG